MTTSQSKRLRNKFITTTRELELIRHNLKHYMAAHQPGPNGEMISVANGENGASIKAGNGETGDRNRVTSGANGARRKEGSLSIWVPLLHRKLLRPLGLGEVAEEVLLVGFVEGHSGIKAGLVVVDEMVLLVTEGHLGVVEDHSEHMEVLSDRMAVLSAEEALLVVEL